MEPSNSPAPAPAAAAPEQAPPAAPAAPEENSGAGFWGWLGGVKGTIDSKLTVVAASLEEVGGKVKVGAGHLLDEAKGGFDKVMNSEVVKTAKTEIGEFGSKVTTTAKSFADDVADFIFDEGDTKVFGVPVEKAANGYNVPLVLQLLMARLDAEATKTSGLFDESNLTDIDKENMERCRSAFNRGLSDQIDLNTLSVQAAAVLLLRWFRELPETIVPASVDLASVLQEQDSLQKAVALKNVLQTQVAPLRYNILRLLLGFLKQMHVSQAVTGVDLVKSADMFGPYLLAGYAEGPIQHVVRSMILNFDDYFPSTFVMEGNQTSSAAEDAAPAAAAAAAAAEKKN